MNPLSETGDKRQTGRLALWLGLFLFSVYLFSFSGKFHVVDELMVFTAGHNLAQYGRPDVNQLIWTNHWQEVQSAFWGVDNQLYTKKAPGFALAVAPFVWLGHTLPGLNAVHVSLLLNAVVTALTAALLLVWLVELGFSRRAALVAALMYGLGTIAWIYARMLWEPPLTALMFLLTVWSLRRFDAVDAPRARLGWAALTGLALAVNLLLRFEMAVAAGMVGLYLGVKRPTPFRGQATNDQRRTAGDQRPAMPFRNRLPVLAAALTPVAMVGLGLLYFNYVRFGSPFETGYSREFSLIPPWIGGYGLLFSPGRGLFIYSPVMALLFFGLRPAWRRLPRPYFLLIAALCLFYWLFYGSWFAWGGTWGWGPRFLMPILPLLMLFVAETVQNSVRKAQWLLVWGLFAASLFVNILGVAVDFNEHYLRLGRNDNFVFNWSAMPLLGHWRILREGLVDILWLRPGPDGLTVDWAIFLPSLLVVGLTALGLALAVRRSRRLASPLGVLLSLVVVAGAVFVTQRATARAALADDQSQADLPVLNLLNTQSRPGDLLLVPMPPYGDVQEVTTRLMSYLHRPVPTYAWIESEPRAIQPDERERLRQAVLSGGRRVWLLERWLSPLDPPTPTAAWLNREAFPVASRWFDHSGRLTLFVLPGQSPAAAVLPVEAGFSGGLSLVEAAVLDTAVTPGAVVRVRLTWQAPSVEGAASAGLPNDSVLGFVHLVQTGSGGGPVAQNDRLLVDLQNFRQSPLLPGQKAVQGYGLQLPDDLPPGRYALIAGLYLGSSGQRLARSDGSPDDFVYLMDVVVE